MTQSEIFKFPLKRRLPHIGSLSLSLSRLLKRYTAAQCASSQHGSSETTHTQPAAAAAAAVVSVDLSEGAGRRGAENTGLPRTRACAYTHTHRESPALAERTIIYVGSHTTCALTFETRCVGYWRTEAPYRADGACAISRETQR